MTGEKGMVFPFHYGPEVELYSFYRVPKALFQNPIFGHLSTDAKLLYGLMLDRLQLSIHNGWIEPDGRAYIYFTIGSVMEALNCGNKKASQLMAELDAEKGIGLITRIRQGQGKPDKIFVHKCILPDRSDLHVQRCQNDTSGDVFSTRLEMSKGHTNKTEYNKTDYSKNPSIYLEDPDAIGGDAAMYEKYNRYFREQLCLDALENDNPEDVQQLWEILELLVETMCSEKKTIRISGEEKPAPLVKSRLMKLDCEHIRYVMACMKETTTRIRNIRQYLLAALYNAPMTIGSYYSARVNHDLYGPEV